MSTVKTAVSIEREIFDEVDNVARELNVSRSRVIGLALKEFLKRRQNQRLLEQINTAYNEEPQSEEEEAFLRFGRRDMQRVLDHE